MHKEVTSRALREYTPEEMNDFLDDITLQVEKLVSDLNDKTSELAKKEKEITVRDEKIHRLAMEMAELKKQLKHYEDIEESLSKTMHFAEQEKEVLIAEAKRNADKIVNEALLSAEKTEMEANLLRRNIKLLKNKMKQMVNSKVPDDQD